MSGQRPGDYANQQSRYRNPLFITLGGKLIHSRPNHLKLSHVNPNCQRNMGSFLEAGLHPFGYRATYSYKRNQFRRSLLPANLGCGCFGECFYVISLQPPVWAASLHHCKIHTQIARQTASRRSSCMKSTAR